MGLFVSSIKTIPMSLLLLTFGTIRRRSTNSGSSFTYFPTDNTGSFINPADYDDNKNILYSARNTTTLKRIINMTGSYSAGTITLSGMSSMATHIRVSPYTTATTTLFVGSGWGRF